MGYVEARRLTEADRLDTCDQCNQQGLVSSGQFIMQNGEAVMWLCFNCNNKRNR